MSAADQNHDLPNAPSSAGSTESTESTETSSVEVPEVLEILDEAAEGKVLWYSVANGYGFVQQPGIDDDVFVHYSELADPDNLITGDVIRYQLVRTERGYQAQNVEILVEAEPLDPTP